MWDRFGFGERRRNQTFDPAIAVGVLAVPFSVHVLVHLLGDEALKSHTDPLTGLRNRRGFYRSARELIESSSAAAPYLSLIMLVPAGVPSSPASAAKSS